MRNVIDVSDYQGVIDWEKVKPQIDGAMIRCCWSYGERNDTQFERNITECNRLGIPCGVYLFSYALNDDDVRKEAEWCLELVKHHRLEMPIAWDFEGASTAYAKKNGVTITREVLTRWAHIFLETIEKAGYWATLYSNADYLSRYFEKGIENRFDLWYAGWVSKDEAVYDAKLSYTCGMWQYGGKPYDGISTGNVDSNFCYKDYPNLLKSLKLNHLDKPLLTDAERWAVENGLTADATDKDEPITKGALWEILYKLKEGI